MKIKNNTEVKQLSLLPTCKSKFYAIAATVVGPAILTSSLYSTSDMVNVFHPAASFFGDLGWTYVTPPKLLTVTVLLLPKDPFAFEWWHHRIPLLICSLFYFLFDVVITKPCVCCSRHYDFWVSIGFLWKSNHCWWGQSVGIFNEFHPHLG